MDLFTDSLDKFSEYPEGLVRHDALKHNIQAYRERLDFQKERLFNSKKPAVVDFLDLHDGQRIYLPKTTTTLYELVCHVREAFLPSRSDPQCRFVFLHAPQSLAPLRITYEMLKLLFTYHQVMPSFLDFVFPFGKHVFPQDLYFSGFREDTRLGPSPDPTAIKELGRSGCEMRICYNLRSVERLEDPVLPWSIRQSAVYHTLDIKTGKALCIVVKGNKLIKSRITEASKSKTWSSVTSLKEVFCTTLETHLLMCDWSGENWRWYINDLEDRLQNLTEGVLAIQVDTHTSPALPAPSSDAFFSSHPPRTGTMPPLSPSATDRFVNTPRVASNQFSRPDPSASQPRHISRAPTLAENSRVLTANDNNHTKHNVWARNRRSDLSVLVTNVATVFREMRRWSIRNRNQSSPTPSDVELGATSSHCDLKRKEPDVLPPTHSNAEEGAEKSFTFSDLQQIQHIEEKAQEALLVLNSNTEVLEELRSYYSNVSKHYDFPSGLRMDCQNELSRFDRCVLVVKKDLQMLQARTQTLLQLLANRKNLLNDMLQFQNSRASELLAEEAAQSAKRMQDVTDQMYKIAQRTQEETTSMKIITSVSVTLTLFFLPATFTATFMSADILKYEQGQKNFQVKALRLFICIALPLTVLTFFAWYAIYRWAKKNERLAIQYGRRDGGT